MKDVSNKSYIAVMSVSIICLVVIVFSVTYAYFTPKIEGEGTDVNLMGGKVKLNISEDKINASNLAPIYDSTKDTKAQKNTFTISRSSDSNLDACFALYLVVDEIGEKLKNQYFKYELDYGTQSPVVGDFSNLTFDPDTGKAKIGFLVNQELSDAQTSKSYTLRLWLSYDRNVDQTDLLTGSAETRNFSAHVYAEGQSGKCPVE